MMAFPSPMFAPPAPRPVPAWANVPPPQAQRPMPAPTWQPPAQAASALPRPKVRAVPADDPPPPARLVLDSPEALGIRPAAALALDWNAVHARLQRLQAVRFQVDRLPQGGYRVTFLLPASPGQTQPVEAAAETEAAAVQLALSRAEAWVVARR